MNTYILSYIAEGRTRYTEENTDGVHRSGSTLNTGVMSGVWTARLAPVAHTGSTGTYLDPDVPDIPDAARRL